MKTLLIFTKNSTTCIIVLLIVGHAYFMTVKSSHRNYWIPNCMLYTPSCALRTFTITHWKYFICKLPKSPEWPLRPRISTNHKASAVVTFSRFTSYIDDFTAFLTGQEVKNVFTININVSFLLDVNHDINRKWVRLLRALLVESDISQQVRVNILNWQWHTHIHNIGQLIAFMVCDHCKNG